MLKVDAGYEVKPIYRITDRQDAATTAKRWGMTKRRVLQLCRAGKVYAAKMENGVWTIPTNAVRPPDGRKYRAKLIPKHIAMVLRYADAAVRGVEADEWMSEWEAIEYFIRGSAFHMHTLETSRLTFSDVCSVLRGNAVGGKPIGEQIAVLHHKKAVEYIIGAAGRRRQISLKLVEGVHGLLAHGSHYCREPMKNREYVALAIHRVNCMKAHPIYLAADLLTRITLLAPYPSDSERTAYILANYILIVNGYPPFMLYRAVFRWWREHCRDWNMFSEYGEFDKDAGHDRSYGDLMRDVNATWQLAGTPLDPTLFVSVIAKAVHCSCRRRLMVRGLEPWWDGYASSDDGDTSLYEYGGFYPYG